MSCNSLFADILAGVVQTSSLTPQEFSSLWACLSEQERRQLTAFLQIGPSVASSSDPLVEHAKQIILAEDGVAVTLEAKNKDLLKFGRNQVVGTASATIAIQPTGINNETYVASNLINSIISTDAGDTEEVVVEGHTSPDGLVFTFVTQTVTLTGQTVAPLATPLARVTRVYNNASTPLAGTISVTETDTYAAGVPNTPALVHLQIRAGQQQSEKAATTLSSVDYWIITKFYCDMLTKSASYAEVALEIRLAGKVFRPRAAISCSNSNEGVLEFNPYIIVKPNSDIRLVGVSDSGTGRDVSGGIMGFLLK